MRLSYASFWICFSIIPAAVKAADILGWQATRWGMTKEQVRSLVPAASDFSEVINKEVLPQFGVPDFLIKNCDTKLTFWFDKNKLNEVGLSLKDNKDFCLDIIRNALEDHYGSPSSTNDSVIDSLHKHTVRWNSPTTVVILERLSTDLGLGGTLKTLTINVSYAPVEQLNNTPL